MRMGRARRTARQNKTRQWRQRFIQHGHLRLQPVRHRTGYAQARPGLPRHTQIRAHIEKIVEAGGKLWRPATDVPGMLRFAVMSDPQGAAIVVFTPNPAMPSPERPASPTPGTIGWHELYTTDLEGGFEFYKKLFGWTKLTDMDMGPMGIYRLFDEGDHKEMGDGGMMTKAPEMPASCWNFYFNVDSVKGAAERVKSGGGKVIHGPMQVPGGGWIINGQDPQGAMFSLVSATE